MVSCPLCGQKMSKRLVKKIRDRQNKNPNLIEIPKPKQPRMLEVRK